jgi:hypothetical protein
MMRDDILCLDQGDCMHYTRLFRRAAAAAIALTAGAMLHARQAQISQPIPAPGNAY